MHEAHIIQIPEYDVFLAHGHDEKSHTLIEDVMLTIYDDNRVGIVEGQAVFPMEYIHRFRLMARLRGVAVVEGEE